MRSNRRTLAAGLATTAAAVALVSCAPAAEEADTTTLRIGVTGISVNFDPYNLGGELVSVGPGVAVYDPLIKWDRSSSTFEPWLADEFSVSEDGFTLSMKLREDVDFVDGRHLDAAGVEAYFDTMLAVETSTATDAISPYEAEFTATGEYTLEVTTVQPIRFDFFYLLEEVPIASPAVVDDPEAAVEQPLGSGPYVIDEIVPDVSATMVRNPDYWNPDAYDFDVVTFTVYDDTVAALNALKSGQIDATALDLPLALEAREEGFTIHEGVGPFGTLFIFDRTGAIVPALGDVRVRQAMNMAFDRETIAETLDLGFGTPSSQPFTPGQAEYIEGADDFYSYDLEAAKELLAEAGYPDGFDLPILTIGAPGIEPIVQQSLLDIGIRVTFVPAGDDVVGALTSGDHPVLAFTHYYTNVVRFLDTGSFFAPGGVIDPAIAEVMQRFDTGTAEESAEASQELGRFLIEDAWFVPFSKPPTTWASIPEVSIEVGQILGLPNLREFRIAE